MRKSTEKSSIQPCAPEIKLKLASNTPIILCIVTTSSTKHSLSPNPQEYRDERRGPTFIATQSSSKTPEQLQEVLSCLSDFPLVPLTVGESEENFNYNILDWQRVGAKRMIQHFFNVNNILFIMKVRQQNLGRENSFFRMACYDIADMNLRSLIVNIF